MTGYWFADEPCDWEPPTELRDFLDAGERPVVISLGAMSLGGVDALRSAQLAVEAVRLAGLRAVVQGWVDVLPQMDLPRGVLPMGSAPHSWLLARAACVVHHGGLGTTAAGLRAGIPAVVIPHIIDQYYWGQRAQELGAGPQPIPRSKLTARSLADALRHAVQDETMRAAAAQVGERIRAEDGVQIAVDLIGEVFDGPGTAGRI
ncbi:MAG: glycosyltransferase [Anaerolineae bacterium]